MSGGQAIWVRVALFGDTVGTVAPRLTKGTQVYCERRLTLGTWTGRDGKPKGAQPRGVGGPADGTNRKAEAEGQSRDEQLAVPLDDELRF